MIGDAIDLAFMQAVVAVDDFVIPDQLAGLGLQRDHMAVGCGRIKRVAIQRHVLHPRFAAIVQAVRQAAGVRP